ncbi:MAG TPA: hypothetical protein VHQ66_08400, partial [Myxococcota bacterium]|nr:hypothetical protein [Myxococcota bacterium]
MGVCDATPSFGDLGVAGAKLLAPGDPARSVLSLRARMLGPGQMPPLARDRVDQSGTATLDAWIRSFVSCAGPDSDGDGRLDDSDNCPAASNAGQADFDADGIGDACETVCHDGVDNDGDGKSDYPLDPGCASAASLSENPRCDNGVDDDGDGRVDAPVDIGCGGATATREDPACADGVDNDGDGHIDFDGGRWLAGTALTAPDASCGSRPFTASENAGSGCGLGFELVPALALLSALRRRRRRG